jgi:hypothetical protein
MRLLLLFKKKIINLINYKLCEFTDWTKSFNIFIMKKITGVVLSVLLSVSFLVRADEGMWLPILINNNMATMTSMGIELTADDIFSINNTSIKDAIIALDHGSCTGEVISAEGLVLTNHHCGYGEIQEHSCVEHDYLTEGFWAMSKDEELANPGKTVSFLKRTEDVSDRILSELPNGISQEERKTIVDSIISVIIDEVTEDTDLDADVESMFKGNSYYLFVYQTFKDIRLVGAPPEAIGKFGSDTDNWMWPRHTGDFSIFRIYTDSLGNPAEYSENNIPYKSKYFLPISVDGYKKGDFTFIMGYPGSTTRYLTSFGLRYVMDYENPNRVKIRGVKQNIWKKYMDKDDQIRIQYSAKYARSSNYWKYSLEQNKALKKLGVYEQKVRLEEDFTSWVNADDNREVMYGKALSLIKESTESTNELRSAKQYLVETQIYGSEVFLFAYWAEDLFDALEKDSVDLINERVFEYEKPTNDFFKNYNIDVDKESTIALIELFVNDVDEKYYPDYIDKILKKKYKGNVEKFVNDIYAKSIFTDKDRMEKFLSEPKAKVLSKDMVFIVAKSIINKYQDLKNKVEDKRDGEKEGMRLFVAGLMEKDKGKMFYPDANSTMRLTYGTVGDYSPGDAVQYSYYTTLKGVMEKEDADNPEFNVPAKLKDIYLDKDYGIYGNSDGTMNVCFTTNNDITGGNSGSPVINAKGQLIGVAFDGNSESMSGDITFENTMQKCINVDIRYILLIIDKYAGATNLIEEMNIVKTQ